ncbi:MAG: helix-turn-helix domain-containing protein [Patescibacteria group bacterium]
MPRFNTHQINSGGQQGSILTNQRQARGLSLDKVSRTTGINGRYLQALEQGRWYDLPFGSYGRMFFKKYAQFLGLDQADLKFDSVLPTPVFFNQARSFGQASQLTGSWQKNRLVLLLLIGAAVLIYLLAGAWLAIVPPRLSLVEPIGDFTTAQPTVLVKGTTRPGTLVFINNQSLAVGETGGFSVQVPLQPGLNTLTIEAQKNYGQRIGQVRRIMFKPAAEVGLPLQIF